MKLRCHVFCLHSKFDFNIKLNPIVWVSDYLLHKSLRYNTLSIIRYCSEFIKFTSLTFVLCDAYLRNSHWALLCNVHSTDSRCIFAYAFAICIQQPSFAERAVLSLTKMWNSCYDMREKRKERMSKWTKLMRKTTTNDKRTASTLASAGERETIRKYVHTYVAWGYS